MTHVAGRFPADWQLTKRANGGSAGVECPVEKLVTVCRFATDFVVMRTLSLSEASAFDGDLAAAGFVERRA